MAQSMPGYLTHYYERRRGPFKSLTALPRHQAEYLLDLIRDRSDVFASQRPVDYLQIRLELEATIRRQFTAKGGHPRRKHPHYLILGESHWVLDWYKEGAEIRVPLAAVDPKTVSFTYGDSFPAMRFRDGKPYRRQVYTLDELNGVIQTYGLPQHWNATGKHGPERYIEAQLWVDPPAKFFLTGIPT